MKHIKKKQLFNYYPLQQVSLQKADFDKDSGKSIVVITTPLGDFTATAQVHPKEVFVSRFFGCELAERRAKLKFLQAEKEQNELALAQTRPFTKRYDMYFKRIVWLDMYMKSLVETTKIAIKDRDKVTKASLKI